MMIGPVAASAPAARKAIDVKDGRKPIRKQTDKDGNEMA
jgi:hypothetical protein